ncbi:CP12 domain-containing protein [Myxosarcina sp. GI1(2024)]
MSDIQEQINLERQKAREVCDLEGNTSEDCAVAWDTVEELQAEASHQRAKAPKKNSLEQYCDDNPDAPECRMYEE